MKSIRQQYVNEYLYRTLLHLIPDSVECGEVVDALQDDVMQDIRETADLKNWNSGDIDIALSRVLRKRLLKEESNSQGEKSGMYLHIYQNSDGTYGIDVNSMNIYPFVEKGNLQRSVCAVIGKNFPSEDNSIIKKKYDEYVGHCILKPLFVEATVKFKDGDEESGMVFKLNRDKVEDEDSHIFYYLQDINELDAIANGSQEDFTIIPESVEFFDKL